MKRTTFVKVLAALTAASMLTACGSTASTTTTTGTSEAASEAAATEAAGSEAAATEAAAEFDGNVSGKDGKKTLLSFGAGTAQEMSPWTSSSAGNMTFRTVCYMQLAYDDGEGWLTSDACESIEQADEEGYVWTIKLYEGIKDSDGNVFDASDLVYDMNKIKEIGKISYYSVFESVEQVDDLTVTLTLNSKQRVALIDLCNNTLLVTQEAYEASGEDEMKEHPVGTTQYKVIEFVPSSYVLYEKVEDYWQKDESKITRAAEANVDYIKITMLKETAQKLSGLQTGDLQLANNMTYLNTVGLDTTQYNIFEKKNTASCDNLCFNMTGDSIVSNDINLRMAILYAIDNNAILAALGGQGEAMKSEVTSDYGDYNADWATEDYWDYDEAKAKDYLSKSSYNGETIRLLNSTDETVQTRNEVIVSELTAIGINCELNTFENNVYQQNQYASSGEWDICALGFGANDYLYADAAAKIGSDSTSDIPGTTKYGWADADFIQMCTEVGQIGCENTEEMVNKIHDYAKENAVMKGLVSSLQFNISVNTIDSLMVTRAYVRAGATHFTEDYAVYYE